MFRRVFFLFFFWFYYTSISAYMCNLIVVSIVDRPEEKGQANATGYDDGGYDGRGGYGPDGVQSDRPDGRQGAVAQQNRAGPVRHHRPEEAHPAAVGWPRDRDGVPSLRPQHAAGRRHEGP